MTATQKPSTMFAISLAALVYLVGVPTEIFGQPTVITQSSLSEFVYVDTSTIRWEGWEEAKGVVAEGGELTWSVMPRISYEVVTDTQFHL